MRVPADATITCHRCGATVRITLDVSGVHVSAQGAYAVVYVTGLEGCEHVEDPRGSDEGEPVDAEVALVAPLDDFFRDESPSDEGQAATVRDDEEARP